jgi:hypothetical protein
VLLQAFPHADPSLGPQLTGHQENGAIAARQILVADGGRTLGGAEEMLKEAGAEIRLVCQIQAQKQALKMREFLDEAEAAAYARWVHLKRE